MRPAGRRSESIRAARLRIGADGRGVVADRGDRGRVKSNQSKSSNEITSMADAASGPGGHAVRGRRRAWWARWRRTPPWVAPAVEDARHRGRGAIRQEVACVDERVIGGDAVVGATGEIRGQALGTRRDARGAAHERDVAVAALGQPVEHQPHPCALSVSNSGASRPSTWRLRRTTGIPEAISAVSRGVTGPCGERSRPSIRCEAKMRRVLVGLRRILVGVREQHRVSQREGLPLGGVCELGEERVADVGYEQPSTSVRDLRSDLAGPLAT